MPTRFVGLILIRSARPRHRAARYGAKCAHAAVDSGELHCFAPGAHLREEFRSFVVNAACRYTSWHFQCGRFLTDHGGRRKVRYEIRKIL